MPPLRTALALATLTYATLVPAATWIVDNGSDSTLSACEPAVAADCSLRGALTRANALNDGDTIEFAIPAEDASHVPETGHWRIVAASDLPLITAPLVIDGFTQPGAAPNANPPGAGIAHTLKIELRGPNLSTDGLSAFAPTTVRGLALNNWRRAIFHFNLGPNIVEGNYIGTDVTGLLARPNVTGVTIGGDVRIGGLDPAQGNVIAANRDYGLSNQAQLTSVRIQGNIIGASADLGSVPGRQDFGMYLLDPRDAMIGGVTPAEGNAMAGNGFSAISISASTFQSVDGTPHVRIQGNRFGIGLDGRPLGNGHASSFPTILISLGGYCRAVVGGMAPGESNLIAHGRGAGIAIGSCWNAHINGNRFHGNRGIPIDLAGSNAFDGPTANDAADADAGGSNPVTAAGGNRLQNVPTVTLPPGLLPGGGDDVTIDYVLDSLPGNSTYPITVQFHRAACGGGSAELLAEAEIDEINAQQPLQQVLSVGGNVLPLTVTATDALGNTSEFGPVFGETLFVDGLEEDPAAFGVGNCNG